MNYRPNIDDIFISTISKNIIDASNLFSKKHNKKIVLLASLNQINNQSYSYVFKNMNEFKKYVNSFKNKKIFIGRDHLGFDQLDKKKNKTKILEQIIHHDIDNNIDFVHIDMSNSKKHHYFFNYYIQKIINLKKEIKIEIGLDPDGKKTNFINLNKLIYYSNKYNKNISHLTFQTGTKLFNNKNISKIDYKKINNLKKSIKFNNTFYKEHNSDFKNKTHFKKLKKNNFVFNIGPEFAYYENYILYSYAKKLKEDDLIKTIIKLVIKSNKWKKWCNKNQSKLNKFFSSAHYFNDNEKIVELKKKISLHYPINEIIIKHHLKLLEKKFVF